MRQAQNFRESYQNPENASMCSKLLIVAAESWARYSSLLSPRLFQIACALLRYAEAVKSSKTEPDEQEES